MDAVDTAVLGVVDLDDLDAPPVAHREEEDGRERFDVVDVGVVTNTDFMLCASEGSASVCVTECRLRHICVCNAYRRDAGYALGLLDVRRA